MHDPNQQAATAEKPPSEAVHSEGQAPEPPADQGQSEGAAAKWLTHALPNSDLEQLFGQCLDEMVNRGLATPGGISEGGEIEAADEGGGYAFLATDFLGIAAQSLRASRSEAVCVPADSIRTGSAEEQVKGACDVLIAFTKVTRFHWGGEIIEVIEKVTGSDSPAFPVLVAMVTECLRGGDAGPATDTEEKDRQATVAEAGVSWEQLIGLVPHVAELIRTYR